MESLKGFKEYHGEKVYKLIEEYIGSLKKEEEDLSECLRELSIKEVDYISKKVKEYFNK